MLLSYPAVFGSFGYAKMSLYDHHLSSLSSLLVLLASVSVDSLPVTIQNGCHIMILLPPSRRKLAENT